MRNVIATVMQTAALGCFLVGLWFLSPLLAVAIVVGGGGWFLAPDKHR